MPDGSRFCPSCGARVVVVCPTCGTENSGGEACPRCGRPRDQDAAASGRLSRLTRDVLEPILQSPGMLVGERKEITVLFGDIKGSTELVAGIDPEQAMQRLDGALSAMIAAVRRYEGFVNRIQGDGIMALFGAPLADQDHAVRACLAALAMQSTVRDLAGHAVTIRVGLHSGPVVVRAIRNDLTMAFDAFGEAVHVAARMEQAAAPGTIRITGDTCRAAKGFINVEPVGAPAIKGMERCVEQFILVSRTALRTRWDARVSSGLTPFVAREPELAVLRHAAAVARAGDARAVLISGDPGSGKSRLVHEFLRSLAVEDWLVLRCGAEPFSANAPYGSIAMLLRAWLGIDEREHAAPALRAALLPWSDAGRWIHSALCGILDVQVDDAEWQALEPTARRRRTIDAVAEWAAWLAAARPLLLLVEDMHWADGESTAVVSRLARAEGSRMLLVLTRRWGEEGGELEPDASCIKLPLDPLLPDEAELFLSGLLGETRDLAGLKQLVVEKTGGIPLFLEETARALAESGALDAPRPSHGRWPEAHDVVVPSNVHLVLASRIDRLPPAAKQLLQIAAVVGREAPTDVIEAVAELPRSEVRAGLAALEQAGFLRSTEAGHCTFSHMLTRDVSYASLLMSRRTALHQQVVAAIEKRGDSRLGDRLHLLVHHAMLGGLWEKALHYLLRAANRAIDLSAYMEAARLFEQAVEALRHLPRTPEFLARGIDVRLSLRAVLGTTLDLPRISRFLAEAKVMAAEIGDRRRLGAIAISEAMMLNQHGDCERAMAAVTLAQSMAEKLDDQRLIIPARIYLGQAHLWRGELAQALAELGRDIGWINGALRHERLGTTGASSVACLGFLASASVFVGRFDDAERFSRDAVAIAEEVGRPYDLVFAGMFRGWVLCHCGRVEEGLRALEPAHRLCEAMDIRFFGPVIAMGLGFAYVESGWADQGAELLSAAMATHHANAQPYNEAWTALLLGFARLHQGDAPAAAALGAQALDMARHHHYGVVDAIALRLLGAAESRLPHPSATVAERYFEAALARAASLGLEPQIAHCHFDRAMYFRRAQRRLESRHELGEALEIYTRLGAEGWRHKAAAAMRSDDGPA